MPPLRQEDRRMQLLDTIEAQTRRILPVRDGLREDQVGWRPPGSGWSIGQVFEHLVVSADSYLDRVRPFVESAREPEPRARTATWTPSVMGGLLARSLAAPRRLPAPPSYRPGPAPRPRVIDAFLERHRATADLLGRSGGLVWQDCRIRSPITALIRMNLGDAFSVLVVHAGRHLDQVDRVRAHAAFPE
jgi:hypothetical protein